MATEQKDSKWTMRRSWRMRQHTPLASGHAESSPEPVHGDADNPLDNPWLLLHQGDANPPMPPVEPAFRPALHNSALDSGNAQRVTSTQPPSTSKRVRWLSEASSPYGFSDEDGSLKQGDADTWRRAFSGVGDESHTPVSTPGGRRPPTSPGPSTWWYQLVAAMAVVALGIYSTHGHTALASDVEGVYQTAFAQDDGTALWKRADQFILNHHIAIPGLSTNFGAIQMHIPLRGKVIRDYSPGQPEMLIQGSAGERVLSAGSGTVTKVTQIQGGYLIEINHGSIGTTWYTGVTHPTVRLNEYVTAGQVIGQLPATPAHPTLQFALEKNNQFENPHDYIVFPGSIASP